MQHGVGQPGDAPQAPGPVEIGHQRPRPARTPKRRLPRIRQQRKNPVTIPQKRQSPPRDVAATDDEQCLHAGILPERRIGDLTTESTKNTKKNLKPTRRVLTIQTTLIMIRCNSSNNPVVVTAHHILRVMSTMWVSRDTTFVRRVNLARWWRVLLFSRSMAAVCAFPTTWRSGGRTAANASQASV
jgi:hypothetical protein